MVLLSILRGSICRTVTENIGKYTYRYHLVTSFYTSFLFR